MPEIEILDEKMKRIEEVISLADLIAMNLDGGLMFVSNPCIMGRIKAIVLRRGAAKIHLGETIKPRIGKCCWDFFSSETHEMDLISFKAISLSGGGYLCFDVKRKKPSVKIFPREAIPPGRANTIEKMIKLGIYFRAQG